MLDRRLNAFRPDIAAESLRGRVQAARYVTGELRQVTQAVVPLRSKPEQGSLDNEVLFGEHVRVFEEAGGWAWVQLARDGYVGYVPAEALTGDVLETTHRVSASGTFVYPMPDIKSIPIMHLSMNAKLTVVRQDDRLMALSTGGWVVARHLAEEGRFARDFVEIAERFIGTPYLWGGRTRLGLDCSALVQLALEASGRSCPRDSDLQQAQVGVDVLVPPDLEGLERGDLVFWQGHVGIMMDGVMMVHANAHHMAVAVEPLKDAADRAARLGNRITAVKRIPALP
jgi:cell wall-associated NlpC family hydrolase